MKGFTFTDLKGFVYQGTYSRILGFIYDGIHFYKHLYLKGFVLKELSKEGILSDSHPNSLYFAFQDDYSYQIFFG